jgi:glycosyltransferase involved in cell wall biosynthesis
VNNGRSKGVERLVASLKAQTHENIEFIAVDSGSTDDTVPWLRSQGFKVIEIPPASFNHAHSRNTGAAAATGKYLLFVVDDAIFVQNDWLRSALFILNRSGAASLSGRQAIDQNADAYARLLDSFLATHQSARPNINIARNGYLARRLRRVFPLSTQFRSVSIDDTNHLVRSEIFEKLKFASHTVEDIEFALRLVRAGYTTAYTNLLTIIHYHRYTEASLPNYAKRVYIDLGVISSWQSLPYRLTSRDSFLNAAYHVLAVFLQAIDEYRSYSDKTEDWFRLYDLIANSKKSEPVAKILNYTSAVSMHQLSSFSLGQSIGLQEARSVFVSVLGGEPPPDLYYSPVTYRYMMSLLRNDLLAARNILAKSDWIRIPLDDIRQVCLFLWCNRTMNHVARRGLFDEQSIDYAFDRWDISDWR